MEPDIQITTMQGITRITYRGQARFSLTTEMIREAALIGFRNRNKLLLLDVCESFDPEYQENTIKHAEQASILGIEPDFRIAILGKEDDQRLPYFEEVAVSHGLQVKSFINETNALNWLLTTT